MIERIEERSRRKEHIKKEITNFISLFLESIDYILTKFGS